MVKGHEFRPGLGIGKGLVAAEGVAEAEASAVEFKGMADGLAGIGAGGVHGIGAIGGFGGQGHRAGPVATGVACGLTGRLEVAMRVATGAKKASAAE